MSVVVIVPFNTRMTREWSYQRSNLPHGEEVSERIEQPAEPFAGEHRLGPRCVVAPWAAGSTGVGSRRPRMGGSA